MRAVTLSCSVRQSLLLRPLRLSSRQISSDDSKKSKSERIQIHNSQVDKSRVPQLNEKDLEEHFVSGSGPGGQSVNKSVNCCQLKHLPTGLTVKVHQTRSLDSNRKIARELLITKLDNYINGENSMESQRKRIALNKIALRKAEQEKKRKWKEGWRSSINRSMCQIEEDDERT